MRRSIIVFILILMMAALSSTSTMAQDIVDIGVNVTCSSVSVTLNSNYDNPVIAQVYAGNNGDTAWNLVDDIGNFTRAAARGSGSRTYSFSTQPANTSISFSVRVYDDLTNTQVAMQMGTRDCDGDANNQTTSSTTTTTTTTASFLTSCDVSGGIVVQPIGGVAFTVNSTQIAQGTAMAIANNQNTVITVTGNITVSGTPANAVQLSATDGYSITVPASSCAQTVVVTTTSSTASTQAANLSCNNTPADAAIIHVVSPGENLFRIGLRYGIHFTTLATYNGIPDSTRIFVGQCIGIPASA